MDLHAIDSRADVLLRTLPSVTVYGILCREFGAVEQADRNTVSERVTVALLARKWRA